MMKISIGIKALNEELHIAEAVETALAAVAPHGGEVIVADSGSTDATLAIAGRYPIRIVQLARVKERCCGAGAQLAFQHARGDYFYLLDGDMAIAPGFIEMGLAYLDSNPDVAGVGGTVIERNVEGQDFRIRAQKVRGFEGRVDRLDCGGLYRAEAIRAVGYFADRNLHAFEELDLGARLAQAGWGLARIDRPGVYHHGHATGGYRLLWRRLRTGYAGGAGEVVRAALGRPHMGVVLRRLWQLQVGVLVMLWWIAIAGVLIAGQPLWLVVLIGGPQALLTVRRRSFGLALYSLAAWNVATLGLLGGLFQRRVSPEQPLETHVIRAADDGGRHAG